MAETRPPLRAVDRLEVTILMDNSIDVFLPSTEEVAHAIAIRVTVGRRQGSSGRTWLLGAGERSRSRPLGDSSLRRRR